MTFIFGEQAFNAASSAPSGPTTPFEPSGSTDSVSLESVDPAGEEWEMWETLKALRAQTARRGRRARAYRLTALRFKRSNARALREAEEYKRFYHIALERTEMMARSMIALETELDELKARLAARERQPLPELGKNATCVICLDHPRGTAFVPCGHIACCQQCADMIDRSARRDRLVPRCPICKTPISKAQVLYYA